MSETLVYIDRRRSIGKGALIGGSALAAAVTPWALTVWPPISYGLIPFMAAVGALSGAVAGIFMRVEHARMLVEIGSDGKVVKREVTR
jgi:hypothetical protein